MFHLINMGRCEQQACTYMQTSGCINLCLQEVTRSCKCIKEVLNFLMEAIQEIKLSHKHQVMLESIQKQEESHCEKSNTLPYQVTVRTGAKQAIIRNYKTLAIHVVTMEEASHNTHDCSRHTSGVATLMTTFFGLKVSTILFSITEQLSCTLQGREINTDDSLWQ